MMVTLRYFACRGRAQPLRYLLADAGVEFRDELVGLDEGWLAGKENPASGGPFAALPVLSWDDLVLGETLAIAGYLDRRLGHTRGRSDEELARLEMVGSAAYVNLLGLVPTLLVPFPSPHEEDWPAFLQAFVEEIPRRVARFERLLAAGSAPFFGGATPVAADFFVYEVVQMWRALLEARMESALADWPRLRAHVAAVEARPRVREYLDSGRRPLPITVSPREAEIRARLRRAP
jgi:glutathione S-transferase